MQVIYLRIKSDSDDSVNNIVFLSMVLSVLSIIAASLSQISRCCEGCRSKSHKFTNKLELSGKLVINSQDLQNRHGFAHNKISDCVNDVLETCQDSKKWTNRSDVNYTIEVFYIQNYISTLKEIHASFLIEVFILGDYFDISETMQQNIQSMGVRMHKNQKQLSTALKSTLNITVTNKILIKDFNMIMENIDENYKDGQTRINGVSIVSNIQSPGTTDKKTQLQLNVRTQSVDNSPGDSPGDTQGDTQGNSQGDTTTNNNIDTNMAYGTPGNDTSMAVEMAQVMSINVDHLPNAPSLVGGKQGGVSASAEGGVHGEGRVTGGESVNV